MNERADLTLDLLQQVADQTELHKVVNMKIVETAGGKALITFEATAFTRNLAGVLHGGIMYSMLDVACYTALVPRLKKGQHAVTHGIQCSIMRPVAMGSLVEVRGEVRGIGRHTAFMDAVATVKGRTVATGSLTKSILAMPVGK